MKTRLKTGIHDQAVVVCDWAGAVMLKNQNFASSENCISSLTVRHNESYRDTSVSPGAKNPSFFSQKCMIHLIVHVNQGKLTEKINAKSYQTKKSRLFLIKKLLIYFFTDFNFF